MGDGEVGVERELSSQEGWKTENLGGSEGVEFVSFKKVNNREGERHRIRPGWWKERLRSPSDSKLG